MLECEWKADQDSFYEMSCNAKGFQQGPFDYKPETYMTYCYGCGKKIKFVENKDE